MVKLCHQKVINIIYLDDRICPEAMDMLKIIYIGTENENTWGGGVIIFLYPLLGSVPNTEDSSFFEWLFKEYLVQLNHDNKLWRIGDVIWAQISHKVIPQWL